jgi:hypothetical protein
LTPLPLPERVTFTTNAGDDDLIEITGNFRDDIRTALAFEHGDCEDAGCDIAVARIEGFPLTAAYLLTGATETPVLDAVQRAYADAGAIPEEDALTDFPASERTAWFAWHEANARTCPSCNSVTYALQEVEPEECANCRASLMRDYVFACVIHARSNRGPTVAYDEFVEAGNLAFDDDTLFVSGAYTVTREQVENPDFDVTVRANDRELERAEER